jgi:hypothetical protein
MIGVSKTKYDVTADIIMVFVGLAFGKEVRQYITWTATSLRICF